MKSIHVHQLLADGLTQLLVHFAEAPRWDILTASSLFIFACLSQRARSCNGHGVVVSTFVTVCLRSKRQIKQQYNCIVFFFTIARFELELQIRETQSCQTSSSGNMPRRNRHCKYLVINHFNHWKRRSFTPLQTMLEHSIPTIWRRGISIPTQHFSRFNVVPSHVPWV